MARKTDPGNSNQRPKIWVDGSQRPPFDFRALCRASHYFARTGIAPIFAGLAGWGKLQAERVRDGAGRIPTAKLGRAARFVPSHQRVAMWIKNWAAVHAHASATADPDVKRGNALVTQIEEHLWPLSDAPTGTPPPPGQLAATIIQMLGFASGWAGTIFLLPYGLIRALWAYASGQDLRKIGTDE